MKNLNLSALLVVLLCLPLSSCSDDADLYEPITTSTMETRAVVTPDFDWENADWMPTPPNQSRIPSPWIGQGSLTSLYGIEIINDRKKSEGWELLYSTFDANAPGKLVNPYFILYNKYRGTMRIFLYLTTEFVTTSRNIQDCLSVVSTQPTSMLNFLGQDMVDATKNSMGYQQIQPVPADGTAPLASNKWYMLEYDIAYDPNVSKIPYNNIQLSWSLNYMDVKVISLDGKMTGSLNGLIGQAISEKDNLINSLKQAGKKTFIGVLSGIGSKIISNNTINESTGENKLGLSKAQFETLSSSLKGALSGGLPGAALGFFKVVFGGTAGPTPISFTIKADITMSGTENSFGSFPSSPTSFWVPGTNISSTAVGYIPLYNKTLGVINFVGKPDYVINVTTKIYEEPDEPFDPDKMMTVVDYKARCPSIPDYSDHLIVNPEVQRIADVTIERQDLIVTGYNPMGGDYRDFIHINPDYYIQRTGTTWGDIPFPYSMRFGVRFTIKVAPHDGTPVSYIMQTFLLNDVWTIDNYLYDNYLPKK